MPAYIEICTVHSRTVTLPEKARPVSGSGKMGTNVAPTNREFTVSHGRLFSFSASVVEPMARMVLFLPTVNSISAPTIKCKMPAGNKI